MTTRLRHIPLATPVLAPSATKYVLDALEHVELSWHGSYAHRFEKELATYVGTDHAITCSSGTAALHLALRALGVGPTDEVIVPALTYVATANAVRYCDAVPVIADVDPQTWTLSPDCVEDIIAAGPSQGRRLAGVIAVHLYGVPCDMTRLRNLCNKHKLFLLEDAAQALGATWLGLNVGSISDVACFSFYANKVITTGEGGALCSDDQSLVEKAIYYRGQCQDRPGAYEHSDTGYNYRMTNLQAAVGVSQLEQIELKLAKRRNIGDTYRRCFAGKLAYQKSPAEALAVDWMFSVLVPDGVSAENVRQRLHSTGVETRPMFVPMSSLPMFKGIEKHEVAEWIYRQGLNLPTHELLTREDVEYVVECTLAAVGAESS